MWFQTKKAYRGKGDMARYLVCKFFWNLPLTHPSNFLNSNSFSSFFGRPLSGVKVKAKLEKNGIFCTSSVQKFLSLHSDLYTSTWVSAVSKAPPNFLWLFNCIQANKMPISEVMEKWRYKIEVGKNDQRTPQRCPVYVKGNRNNTQLKAYNMIVGVFLNHIFNTANC